MKIIDLEQGSPEWHEWRKKGIGSSDIATIMKVNPYQTPYQLWLQKCGVENTFNENRFTTHGKLNEPLARDWINREYGLNLEALCIEDEEQSLYKASLDGYDKGMLYEIKSPYSLEKLEMLRTSTKPPIEWEMQVRWSMMIAGLKKGFLAIWDFNLQQCFVFTVEKDEEIEGRMRQEALDFWYQVKTFEAPALIQGDYIEIEDEELHSYLLEYGKASQDEKKAKEINPEMMVVMISAFATAETAVEAMREGAYD